MLCLLATALWQVKSDSKGAWFHVCPKKAEKWASQLGDAIEALHLDSGSAQKLAGRLNFATQHLFHRLGRAMIKPIYAQKTTGTGKVGPRLLAALKWWRFVLETNVTEHRPWEMMSEERVCRLFVDAASTPPRCAAVLFIDGRVLYTDVAPNKQLLDQLAARNDKQITSLVCLCCHVYLCALCSSVCQEIIGILLAIATFANELRDRKVVLYSDNKGAHAVFGVPLCPALAFAIRSRVHDRAWFSQSLRPQPSNSRGVDVSLQAAHPFVGGKSTVQI